MRQLPKLARFHLRLAWLYRERDGLGLPPADPPKDFATFDDFLQSLAKEWPSIPVGEQSTLKASLARYQDLLNRSSGQDIRYEVNVMQLVCTLQRRMGDDGEALKTVRALFSLGARGRQNARDAVQKNVNAGENQSIANFCQGVIDRASTLSEELSEIVFKKELPLAKEEVIKLGLTDPQAVLEKLRELKFADVTSRRVSAMFAKAAGGKK